MAGNMFLYLKNISGESMDEDYGDQIDIHEWIWSITNNAPLRLTGSDTNTAHTKVNHITISKMFDNASIALINYCVNGTHIPEGIITCVKYTGEDEEDFRDAYLNIELTDVKIASVSWSGKGEETRGIPETVELAFLKFRITYQMQSQEGNLTGRNSFSFDLPEQKGKPAGK